MVAGWAEFLLNTKWISSHFNIGKMCFATNSEINTEHKVQFILLIAQTLKKNSHFVAICSQNALSLARLREVNTDWSKSTTGQKPQFPNELYWATSHFSLRLPPISVSEAVNPPYIMFNKNTSMTVTNGKVCFDVLLVAVGSLSTAGPVWHSFVHRGLGCWLVSIAVPARLTHCYENIQASHSEPVYIWRLGPELTPDPEPEVGNVTHTTVKRWCSFPPVMGRHD